MLEKLLNIAVLSLMFNSLCWLISSGLRVVTRDLYFSYLFFELGVPYKRIAIFYDINFSADCNFPFCCRM